MGIIFFNSFLFFFDIFFSFFGWFLIFKEKFIKRGEIIERNINAFYKSNLKELNFLEVNKKWEEQDLEKVNYL